MASTAAQRRGLNGVNRLRRKLRNMHKLVENRVKPEIEKAAQAILTDMYALTPVMTGRLKERLAFKVAADGLTARIGLLTQARAADAFYFAFLDSGTKGYAPKNIPPTPALHIRERAFDANREKALAAIREAINRTMAEVANG